MVEETPEEIRLRLAAKISEVFDLTTKPSWCRTQEIAKETLKKWAKEESSYFAEQAKPIALHKHYEDIPFEALGSVEAMEPFFWSNSWNIHDYKYMLAVYLRGMLLAPKEMDVAFDSWITELMRRMYLPREFFQDLKQVNYRSIWWKSPDTKSLEQSSAFLLNFTVEQRQFIAEFFREFYAMFPYLGELDMHPEAMQLAENFWDGVYLKD